MSRATRFAFAAVLIAAPLFAHADSSAAMDACVDAFLAQELPKDQKISVRKDLDSVPRPLAVSRVYHIEVVAKTRDGGKELARSVCHVNKNGEVVALNGRAPAAVLSSR